MIRTSARQDSNFINEMFSTTLLEQAMELYAELSESDSAKDMLEYILKNYLSGADALEALQSMKNEWYDINEEDIMGQWVEDNGYIKEE